MRIFPSGVQTRTKPTSQVLEQRRMGVFHVSCVRNFCNWIKFLGNLKLYEIFYGCPWHLMYIYIEIFGTALNLLKNRVAWKFLLCLKVNPLCIENFVTTLNLFETKLLLISCYYAWNLMQFPLKITLKITLKLTQRNINSNMPMH